MFTPAAWSEVQPIDGGRQAGDELGFDDLRLDEFRVEQLRPLVELCALRELCVL